MLGAPVTPSVAELCRAPNKAEFLYYENGNLWYVIRYDSQLSSFFVFPVPAEEADSLGGRFLREDRAGMFMKWIKRQHDDLNRTP